MKHSSIFVLSAVFSQACVVVASDKEETYLEVNEAPYITSADAGCFYDDDFFEDVWYFDANVSDPNSDLDVVAAYFDVYDTWTGELEDTFALDATEDLNFWTTEWYESSTNLDCFYDGYVIDVLAFDIYDEFDLITIIPDTY